MAKKPKNNQNDNRNLQKQIKGDDMAIIDIQEEVLGENAVPQNDIEGQNNQTKNTEISKSQDELVSQDKDLQGDTQIEDLQILAENNQQLEEDIDLNAQQVEEECNCNQDITDSTHTADIIDTTDTTDTVDSIEKIEARDTTDKLDTTETGEETNIVDTQSQHSFVQNAVIPLDSSADESLVVPPIIGKKKMSPQTKKKVTFWSVLAGVCVVVLTLIIVLPIVFINKDKIFVSTAEELIFADADTETKASKRIVLKNDVVVSGDLNISNRDLDLSGHSLAVKGTFSYENLGEKTVNIGSVKGRQYVSSGYITANDIIINLPSGFVDLQCQIEANTINITADSAIVNSAKLATSMTINAKTVVLEKYFDVIDSTVDAEIKINGAEEFLCKGTIKKSDLNISNTKATIAGDIQGLQLDNLSEAIVYGTVQSKIIGGKKVVMMPGHSCEEYESIQLLAIDRKSMANYTQKGCNRVIFIEKHATPSYYVVQQDSQKKINAIVEKMANATEYKFTVGDNAPEIQANNKCDITSFITTVGNHNIKMEVLGDFQKFMNDPTYVFGNVIYMDSEPVYVEYIFEMKLDVATGMKVTKIGSKVELEFNKVSEATKYQVKINGTLVPELESSTEKIDISNFVKQVGHYNIEVVAINDQKVGVKSSDPSYTTYITKQKLASVTNLNCQYEAGGKITLNWTASENAINYRVYIYDTTNPNGSTIEIGSTSLTRFSLQYVTSNPQARIYVVAEGYGSFYDSSDSVYELILKP